MLKGKFKEITLSSKESKLQKVSYELTKEEVEVFRLVAMEYKNAMRSKEIIYFGGES